MNHNYVAGNIKYPEMWLKISKEWRLLDADVSGEDKETIGATISSKLPFIRLPY